MKKWTTPMFVALLIVCVSCFGQNSANHPKPHLYAAMAVAPHPSIYLNTAISVRHQSMSRMLEGSKLQEVLGYDGEFTVFAPSNKALDRLPKEAKERLEQPEHKQYLQAILGGHIVAGRFTASSILRALSRGKGRASFTTLQGAKIRAYLKGSDIYLTDDWGNTAKIITADAGQYNGVIHEINGVFLPPRP
ncbi:fasciclin domain-containing protein [Maribacter sp. 2307ULW6-5]|uniref:fasciclin domain-containing protein n=1 Tax=Maribacter sp. 2307ULW6-5 TaxID=3386275 RepID=UPI0039BC259D